MDEAVHSNPARSRTNDPARTMAGILEVATAEFAEKGLAGGRIEISRTQLWQWIRHGAALEDGRVVTVELFQAVLEEAYRKVRAIEADLNLESLTPEEGLRRLVGFTFDHHHGNTPYIRLVMTENINRGVYLAQSKNIQELNVPAIQGIRNLYDRGVASGVFRPGLDPVDIHASISALTFFNVSNQHTFGLIFKLDTQTPEALAIRRANVIDIIVRYLRLP